MKFSTLIFTATAIFAGFGSRELRADNMASFAITPATGVVTLTPRWGIGGNLAGFHQMSQDLGLGGAANNFYSIKAGAIPAGGDILAFNLYTAASGAASPHADIGSKLTPSSYSALSSADPDVGYGSVNFYTIHHKGTTDYFTVIKPGSGVSSAVTDLKPMSGPGGPATITGVSGYFGLTFAAANLGYGLNSFYYFRTDPATGFTKFGTLAAPLLSGSADQFDLGMGGHTALAFTGSDVGFGTDKMYYMRLDPITGFTIFGTLHPVTGRASDVANLGSVFSTLTFVPGDVGFGSGQFYTTGAINPTWQSVSFAAIADRAIAAGSFTVNPTASSALPITLTVVPGSTGAASISAPVGGVFTITPTAPGVITLQATQAGQSAPTAYEYNMLRQSFTASGTATLAITTQPTNQSPVVGSTANLSVVASGSTALSYQWRKAGVAITGNTSATTATLSLPNVQAADSANYDVVVTNASGSIPSNTVTLTVTTAAPIVTNSPLTAAGTVGTAFSFTITASNSPTTYTASPLPAGLSIVAATGAITGTPTSPGITNVLLGATNATGTGNATLVITVAAAGVAPIVTNNPLTAGGTTGTPLSFTITASGTPTSYSATPLPAGMSIAAGTGVISGTPTTAGTTTVLLGATNATGTGNATLTITVAAAAVAPIITNNALTAAGTGGTPFSYTITASGSPTSFTASPLPAGLSLVAATGVITGTPTATGTTNVVIGATNATGTSNATLAITVSAPTTPPAITSASTAPATIGAPFVTYLIAGTGQPTSYTATGLPPGLTLNSLTGAINGTPTTAGTSIVVLTATNAYGTGNATLTITVAAATVPPIITSPASANGTLGAPFVTYLISATGLPTSYTATGLPPGLTLNTVTGAINGTATATGTFVVTIAATNSSGTSTSTLTITIGSTPTVLSSRITAFSARSQAGTGNQTLIMGFAVSGTKTLVVRGLGFALANLGVPNVLADPQLALYNGSSPIATNDDWSTGTNVAQLVTASANAGLFPLAAGSKDSALLAVVNAGVYTSRVTGANSTSGTAMTEVYDADPTSTASARLYAVSVRMHVATNDGILIGGLIITGNAPKTVLIRGIGPTLATFGVTNVLADPQLTVFSRGTIVGGNDNWETGNNAANLIAAFVRLGEFPLPTGSKDAAMLITLQPGAYTVHLSGVANTTGVALIEVYDNE